MIEAHAFEIIGGVISVLLLVNGYFIANLVKRIETSNSVASDAAAKVESMQVEMKHVKEKVDHLTDVYDRLRALEKQVAVLEYINTHRKEP